MFDMISWAFLLTTLMSRFVGAAYALEEAAASPRNRIGADLSNLAVAVENPARAFDGARPGKGEIFRFEGGRSEEAPADAAKAPKRPSRATEPPAATSSGQVFNAEEAKAEEKKAPPDHLSASVMGAAGGLAAGALIGALIGAVGGPIGMIFGAMVGMLIGALIGGMIGAGIESRRGK